MRSIVCAITRLGSGRVAGTASVAQTSAHPAESYAGLGARLPPVGHVGQVSDVVDAILFLQSSPFITGEVVHVDGGQIAGH
jgi:NAD(P)-dependent dehydrogenase (short-subunit alcohol dehydrogenase family)